MRAYAVLGRTPEGLAISAAWYLAHTALGEPANVGSGRAQSGVAAMVWRSLSRTIGWPYPAVSG